MSVLKPSRLALTVAGALAFGALAACQTPESTVSSAQIETVAMTANQRQDAAAERRLREWAKQGLPVAERELGMLYRTRPAQRAETIRLFESAARAGDAEAAFQLGELYRIEVAGATADPAAAAPWYKLAALQHHARAGLMLGLLYKNGSGVRQDDEQAAKWLDLASDQGNAHAMFLLSYAYNEGRGVVRDPAKGRKLLEEAAEHEYPPAIQELAMVVQQGDSHSAKDELRAGHLMKEATEHRHNNWNRF